MGKSYRKSKRRRSKRRVDHYSHEMSSARSSDNNSESERKLTELKQDRSRIDILIKELEKPMRRNYMYSQVQNSGWNDSGRTYKTRQPNAYTRRSRIEY